MYVFIGSAAWVVNRVIWIYSPAQWIFGSIIWLVTLCFVYKWAQLTDQIKKMCFLTNPNKALRFRKQEINGKNYYDCKEVYDDKTNTSLLVSLHFGCKLIYLAYIYNYKLHLKARYKKWNSKKTSPKLKHINLKLKTAMLCTVFVCSFGGSAQRAWRHRFHRLSRGSSLDLSIKCHAVWGVQA